VGATDALIAGNELKGLRVDRPTSRHGLGDPIHLDHAVAALLDIIGWTERCATVGCARYRSRDSGFTGHLRTRDAWFR
jgi:hypothetical protein